MNKSLLLLSMSYALTSVLCTNTKGNQATQQTPTMLADLDAEEKEFKQKYEENPAHLKELIRGLLNKGYRCGYGCGYECGYEDAESKFFIPFFECFVNREKTDLKIYRDDVTKMLYQKKNILREKGIENFILPQDIHDMITNNDGWIPFYEAKVIANGDTESPESTSTDPPTDTMRKLLEFITTAFKNWYIIVTCEGSRCPLYISRIQSQLTKFQHDNIDKYENMATVYKRFSAFMARGYKMMCLLHHKVNRELRKRSEQNGTATFTDLFFDCMPDFYLPYEQFYFFSVLRYAIEPEIAPLNYFTIQNKPKSMKNDRKWTLIPYDNSDWCNVNKLKEISTTEMSTYKSYPPV